MPLEPGARVGEYEIVGPLGAGGTSEVYRARDLKLGREVAIKILPRDLAAYPDKRSRFEREAQLLAALSHRNIAVIHGLEHDGDSWYLVLELLGGETLAERLSKGPLDLEQARAIFVQIAEALEAAHTKGIIHRDLKPSNVKVLDDGTVKLLDFGLGKELTAGRSASARASQKTATFDGSETSPGLIMGTPGYMSPEQARGHAMAKGTDVWSFGVVLFEALAGVHPFARETIPDMLAAILNDPPPWERLPHDLPSPWRVLLERCLRKKEHDRLHDIADVRIELEEAPTKPTVSARGQRGRDVLVPRWLVVAATLLIALSLWKLWRPVDTSETTRGVVRRFIIDLPSSATISLNAASSLAVSPDGSRLVYATRRGDQTQLYQRVLDQLDTVPLPGTEGGVGPFFAPDSNALGFFAGGKLKQLAFPGGTPVTLADAPSPRGASWSDDPDPSSILFSPSSQGGLSVVPNTGGAPRSLTTVDGDGAAHRWASLLPGGRAALVTVWTRERVDIATVELATGRISPLIDDGSFARYTPSGHLVFQRGGDLYAAAFDARTQRLLSEPVAVVEAIAVDEQTGAAFYDFSRDGALFYVDSRSKIDNPATMLLVGRDGAATPIGPSMASIQVPRFSPNGRFIAATVQNDDSSDIWSLHLERGTLTRLTLEGTNGAAIWTPTGERIAFGSSRDGGHAIYWKPSDGSGVAERLTPPGNAMFPTSFSPDGKTLAYTELHPETGLDIWTVSMETGNVRPLVRTNYLEAGAMFSPSGRYLAFTSDESGREEVYVRAYPGNEGRWQVSTSSGNEPVWSRDGKELFFRSGTNLMAVDVVTEPSFEPGRPRVVVEAPYDRAGALYANYDVGSDGRNFVMIRSEEEAAARQIHVVLHWLDELARRVPIP